jgi:uncharacterized protein (TIGR02246 family)
MTTTEAPVTIAPSDQAAVAALTQRVVAAWAYHDADAFADVFVEDGTMIIAGAFRQGRDEIRSFMAESFEGKYQGSQVTGKPIQMRGLADDVVLLLTRGGVLRAGETEVADDEAIHASWLAVRDNGEWRLAAYQNTPRHA